jgi:hypothetical protein
MRKTNGISSSESFYGMRQDIAYDTPDAALEYERLSKIFINLANAFHNSKNDSPD